MSITNAPAQVAKRIETSKEAAIPDVAHLEGVEGVERLACRLVVTSFRKSNSSDDLKSSDE